MLKIFTDFNARTPDGLCWILVHDNVDQNTQVHELSLVVGDRILLYQDEDDFEVAATLDFKYIDIIGREGWVAIPDWATLIRK
jgi:hypothetical protein